ncbi:MAG TPA: DUF1593 domain-containing protein [Flavitalea sp.]|nr:DUF1593 domain-containing protein [Flavitalea sp.]
MNILKPRIPETIEVNTPTLSSMRLNRFCLHTNVSLFATALVLCLFVNPAIAQTSLEHERPRIIITADPELDDNNSLIRLLLYSSDMKIEGLVYASSQFHWKGDGKGTRWFVPGREYARFGLDTCPCPSWRWAKDERFIHDAVDAYAKVYPNLKVHHSNYPAPDELRSKIRYGNIEFDGDFSKNSPGSEFIKSLILDDKPGHLFITAWGGQSTIARALKSIQDQYEYTTEWEAIKKKISRKVVLLPSGDQDGTYPLYIKPNWPDIEYRQFSEGPNYGYGAQLNARPEDSTYLTAFWMKENVSDRGPFGSLYRVWGDGKQMVKGDRLDYFGIANLTDEELKKQGYVVWLPVQKQGSWLGEGDNHTFMNMLGNGLRAHEAGSFGGWGGRESGGKGSMDFSMSDTSLNAIASAVGAAKAESDYPNFFPQAQRDFAARMQWSVTPKYADANHEPIVHIQGPLDIMASAGETIQLNGNIMDPDKDNVAIKWWQFAVGSNPKQITISDPTALQTQILIPNDAKPGQTIHIILEATDNGKPALTRYQRVVITIREK